MLGGVEQNLRIVVPTAGSKIDVLEILLEQERPCWRWRRRRWRRGVHGYDRRPALPRRCRSDRCRPGCNSGYDTVRADRRGGAIAGRPRNRLTGHGISLRILDDGAERHRRAYRYRSRWW